MSKPPKLKCPHCKWDGSTLGAHGHHFWFSEEVTTDRVVTGFNSDGVPMIDATDHISAEDHGSNSRFRCGNCLGEFPIPESLELDFR